MLAQVAVERPDRQWRLWECDPMLFDCCLPHFGMLGFVLERTLLWRRDRKRTSTLSAQAS